VQPELLTFARTAFFTAIVGLVACSDERGDPAVGVLRTAIVNGEPSDASEDDVVDIYARVSDADILHCSGSLIAPNVLLTALHCVAYRDDPNAQFSCSSDGTLMSATPGAGELGGTTMPSEIEIFVGASHDLEPNAYGFRVFGSGSRQICRGDIAAVVLDRDLGQDFNAVRLGRSVSLGERMRIVGYGQTEEAQSSGRYRRTGLRVQDIGAVGDDPGGGTTAPNTFVLGEGACHGDSGGPAFSEETGALTGVYSLSAAATCTAVGVRNTFTLVSSYESMIRSALESAGHEPVVEEGGGGTGGMAPRGGSGGSGALGEGSGSREDPSCACRTAGGRTHTEYGLFGLVFAMFTAARRRTRIRNLVYYRPSGP
jgi:hypothetical protein